MTDLREALEYRKKPVVIQAVQVTAADYNGRDWDGCPFRLGDGPTPDWLEAALKDGRLVPVTPNHTDYAEWEVRTLEDGHDGRAKHIATPGDWIIRGVQGELYPCKPDIFAATYEPVAANPPSPTPKTAACIGSNLADLKTAIGAVRDEKERDDILTVYACLAANLYAIFYDALPEGPGGREWPSPTISEDELYDLGVGARFRSPTPPARDAARSLLKPVAIALRELEDAERRAFNAHDPNLAKQIGDTARGLSGYLHEVSGFTPPAGSAEVRETLRRIIHDFPMRTARQSGAAEYLGTGWCDNLADALADALSAPVPDDGWRPIEEAPKAELMPILAFGNSAEPGNPQIRMWVRWLSGRDGTGWWNSESNRFVHPTHFRSLPPPPDQGEKP